MEYLFALLGGVMIGSACLILLVFNGKVLGVSGILGGALSQPNAEKQWRLFFLAGLLIGGGILQAFLPFAFDFSLPRSTLALLSAGLLVGYGTRLGNGCTSGHGVCGIGSFSLRSLIATMVFMAFGALTVFVIRHAFGGVV